MRLAVRIRRGNEHKLVTELREPKGVRGSVGQDPGSVRIRSVGSGNHKMSKWKEEVLARFSDREDIGIDEVYARYFMKEGLPKDCVTECLRLIEVEYEVCAGLIRPSDSLQKFLKPVDTRSPLRWFLYRAREEDSESELSYELSKRLGKHGMFEAWQKFETIADYVHAWCGCKPVST